MDCDPPRGIGQPTACPAIPSTSAKAEDAGDSNGRKECAAIPANKARADTLLNRSFVNNVAGQIAGIPNRASANGCRGKCNIGCRNSVANFSQSPANGFMTVRQAHATLSNDSAET